MKFYFGSNRRRHWARLIGWGTFIIFFITVCIPLLFFYYLFDATKVKQMVIDQFNSQNYSVVINGTVEPRSWHGLSLFISDLTVEDKFQHKVMHINTANCQLSWLDLIVAHYRIRRVALNGLTLYQNAMKKGNYVNLLNYQAISHSEFKKLMKLSVTNFNWMDAESNFIVKDASLQLNNLDTLPIIEVKFNLANYAATVHINGAVAKTDENAVFFDKITTSFVSPQLNAELDSHGRYDYKTQEFWFTNISGKGKSDKDGFKLNVDTALFSFYGMTVNKIQLGVTRNNSSSSYASAVNFDIRDLVTNNFKHYELSSAVAAITAQTSEHKFSANLELFGSKFDNNLNLKNEKCRLQFHHDLSDNKSAIINGELNGVCNYDESDGWFNLALLGQVNQSPAKLNLGYYYDSQKPSVKMDGELDKLDLSQFMASSQGNLLPVFFDNSSLPLQWLKWINLSAKLKFHQLNLSHINLGNVNTGVEVRDNCLTVNHIDANAYDGLLSGSAVIDANAESGYNLSVKDRISNMNLQKLFQSLFNVNAINGRANLALDINANNVRTYEDVYRKLDGKILLNVNNGGFSGVDFSLFLSPENLAAFQNKNVIMTKFSFLTAVFDFHDGISKQSTVNFSSPAISASGGGLVDFANTKLDYKLNVSSYLPRNLQNIKSVSIPVVISGDLFAPKIYIQNMTLNSKAKLQHNLGSHKK